jgi:uncharacterized membrane protein
MDSKKCILLHLIALENLTIFIIYFFFFKKKKQNKKKGHYLLFSLEFIKVSFVFVIQGLQW